MSIASNDAAHVKDLYVAKDTLSIRVRLHDLCSTNPYGWANWVFDQYNLSSGMRMLELGCGAGAIWTGRLNRLPRDFSILLTDYSLLMLEKAKVSLERDEHFHFAQVDIQSIPLETASFDAVIANHMLYHVPVIEAGLREVARVLRPGGTFYATTIGERTQCELQELYAPYRDRIPFTDAKASPFTLENGESQLRRHFAQVERREYLDSLRVTDPADLLEYIKSLQTIPPEIEPEFDAHVRAAFEPDGAMCITKEQGMFVCKL